MKKQNVYKYVKQLGFSLLLATAISCTNESVSDSLSQESASQENYDIPINAPASLTGKTVCTETSFPKIGPDATAGKTCDDISNPINIGTLDCRATGAGGYSELQVGANNYGVYKVRGGVERYPSTRTRVERFFNNIDRAANRSIKLTGKFVIPDVSDIATNFAQVHDGGSKIVSGLKVGETLSSANFSVQVKKKPNVSNKFDVFISQSVEPYTTNSSGRRVQTLLITIDKNKEYTLELTTGYNSSQNVVSSVKIFSSSTDSKSMNLSHAYSGEHLGIRYGAYEAADSGDTGAEVRFRDVKLCRTN